jgi:outer membrane protein assembly factor BamD
VSIERRFLGFQDSSLKFVSERGSMIQRFSPSGQVALLLSVLFLMTACSSKVHERPTVDKAMAQAMRSFEKGRHVDALDRFNRMGLDYAGSALMDSIRFMEAECQYNLKDYLLAADLYDEVLERYPSSPLVDDSRVRVADCFFELSPRYSLDQSYTYRAMQEYQGLLDDYPNSEYAVLAEERLDNCRHKLAWKDVKNAELYYRMSSWPAALIYLNEILETWYDQPDVEELAYYYKALSEYRMSRTADARASAKEFLASYPESSKRESIQSLLEQLGE